MDSDAELFDGFDFDDDERRQAAEVYQLDRQLDDQQAGLEHLADEDPVGATWFGDDDAWIEKRLSQRPRE